MALTAQNLFQNFSYRFNQLPASRKMGLAAAVAAAIALIVGLFLWSGSPDYRVLFANLSEKDAGAVTASLQQMNVPYKTQAGGTLLVPGDQVYDLRFKLAAQGLPKGGAVGFELMDTGKLGMTQFQEQVTYQRGLEGELSRTIQSLSPVESARVHLAIPKPSVFIRDRQAPSASVLVNMHPGRVLDAGQVQSIVHLVSSSVPELSPANVTVVDQAGNLLTGRKEAGAIKGLDAGQLDYVRQMEGYYASRIEAIVSPIVGQGNVKAEVRADLDFSESEATSETYRPNPTPETQAIRSQQSLQDINATDTQAQGVPGALSNQPPGPVTAPTTAPAGANAGSNTPANAGSAQAGVSQAGRREGTVNFELDKTIRHTKDPVGRIKRLSVAVVVNYRAASPGPGGEPGKPTPLTAPELEQINNLVKETMGYSQERGDTVNVVNAAFTESRAEMDIPLWKDPETLSMSKSLLKNLLVFALAFYLVFGVLRPLLRDLLKPVEGGLPEGRQPAAGGDVPGGPGMTYPHSEESYAESLARVKDFAKANPQVTAEIIREWMTKE